MTILKQISTISCAAALLVFTAGIANARLFANEVVNTLKSKKTAFAKEEEVA